MPRGRQGRAAVESPMLSRYLQTVDVKECGGVAGDEVDLPRGDELTGGGACSTSD
jgi:hypothetical protein